MKALLLAAGLGTRLRPLTEKLPKPLILVNKVPLIFFPLALLKRSGIREVAINLHYLPEQIPAFLGDGSKLGFSFHYFREEKLLGTGGAIRNAKEFLAGSDFLLLNGDTILDLDIRKMILLHEKKKPFATMALSNRADVKDFGGLLYDSESRIHGLAEKTGFPKAPYRSAVYVGVSVFNEEILSVLEGEGETPCVIRQGILQALDQKKVVNAFLNEAYFADVGSPSRYAQTNNEVREFAPDLFREAETLFRNGNSHA